MSFNLQGDVRHTFRAMGAQNIEWWHAISELIDNSLDAGALRIQINSTSKFFEITDDGRGCADLRRMLQLGSHVDHGTSEQTVGMWGVGLKDAWTFCGDSIEVESVHAGRLSTIRISLSEVPPTGEVDDPVVVATDRISGTRILMPLKRGRGKPLDPTWEKVSWVFTPAMRNQRQIVRTETGKRKTLKPVALPTFIKSVSDVFTVNGKSVEMNIGIIKEGEKIKNGPFWLSYGHRNIDGTSIGSCGKCTLRMGGTIALGKGWVLKKNKDDLHEMTEDLECEIFARINDMLEEQEQLAFDIESAELLSELSAALNESIANTRKERRPNDGESTGTVPPAYTGMKRRHAKHSSSGAGSVFGNGEKKRRGLTPQWEDTDSMRIGVYDSKAKQVRLNLNNPFIAEMKRSRNIPALTACSIALLCHEDMDGKLFEKNGPFRDNFGNIMGTIKNGDEQ